MKKMLFALVCLGLMIFTSCESPVGPTERSTVEFKYVREVESASDTNPLFIEEGATGGGGCVIVWRRTGFNEWMGEKYLDYSRGTGYYAFDVDLACDGYCHKGRRIFARDKDKGQDWIELMDVRPDKWGYGEWARFELGERGVY